MGNKSLKPNTKLLFKSNENLYYTTDILNPNFTKKPKSPIVSDSNQNLRIKPIKSPPYSKNNEILKEIHKTNSFINKFLDFSVCEKVNY